MERKKSPPSVYLKCHPCKATTIIAVIAIKSDNFGPDASFPTFPPFRFPDLVIIFHLFLFVIVESGSDRRKIYALRKISLLLLFPIS